MSSEKGIDVVHLIGSLSAGGAERGLYYLAPFLAKSKFRYAIVCLLRKGEFAPSVEAVGVPVLEMCYRKRYTIQTVMKLAKFLRENRVKILHAHLYHNAFIGRLSAWLAGTPIIIVHEHGMHSWKKWYHRLFERIALIRTDLRLAVSKQIAEDRMERERTPPSKIRIVPCAVDSSEFEIAATMRMAKRQELGLENSIVVGSIGRLIRIKGADLLIEVASVVKQIDKRIKFLIVGSGLLEQDMRSQIVTRDLSDTVFMLGRRTDVPELFAAIDIYLIPSRGEGAPVTLFEAMAAGKPVIATRVGGIPDIIEDGENGILVPPEDSNAMANAILRLANDDDLRDKLGKNARKKFAESYSSEAILSKIEALYDELLEKKGLCLGKFT